MQSKSYTSTPLSVKSSPLTGKFRRADIVFHEVDHSGASYEGRVFINNTNADEKTEKTEANGYAGSFHIFGHGGCFGNVGHCDVKAQRRYDPRPSHPLAPIKTVVIATESLRRAAGSGGDITVTVVPVITSFTPKCDLTDVLKFDHIEVTTYQ